jgi:hypothetical protein
MAKGYTEGSFTASGQSTAVPAEGIMTLSISGFGSATIELQRSYDDGSTWKVVDSFTANVEKNVEIVGANFLWRLDCTWSSGTILYALGSSG